jgi:hypothetical protein
MRGRNIHFTEAQELIPLCGSEELLLLISSLMTDIMDDRQEDDPKRYELSLGEVSPQPLLSILQTTNRIDLELALWRKLLISAHVNKTCCVGQYPAATCVDQYQACYDKYSSLLNTMDELGPS